MRRWEFLKLGGGGGGIRDPMGFIGNTHTWGRGSGGLSKCTCKPYKEGISIQNFFAFLAHVLSPHVVGFLLIVTPQP